MNLFICAQGKEFQEITLLNLKEFGPILKILNEYPTKAEIIKLIGILDMCIVGNYYYYHDVLFGLLKYNYGKKAFISNGKYCLKVVKLEENN